MKFLSIFPFFIVVWTIFIFAYQSYNDESYGDIFFYLILIGILLYLVKNKYKAIQEKKLDVMNTIAINIGLLPLIFSNLVLLPIILQGEAINESGMVFVLVLIYSPMMYIGSLVVLKIYSYSNKNRNT
ncbi:hypothetical protein [Sulfurimonas sp.]